MIGIFISYFSEIEYLSWWFSFFIFVSVMNGIFLYMKYSNCCWHIDIWLTFVYWFSCSFMLLSFLIRKWCTCFLSSFPVNCDNVKKIPTMTSPITAPSRITGWVAKAMVDMVSLDQVFTVNNAAGRSPLYISFTESSYNNFYCNLIVFGELCHVILSWLPLLSVLLFDRYSILTWTWEECTFPGFWVEVICISRNSSLLVFFLNHLYLCEFLKVCLTPVSLRDLVMVVNLCSLHFSVLTLCILKLYYYIHLCLEFLCLSG